jgi:hypothetical protein
MPSAVSKIIQIAVGADGGGTDRLYALTEDGEIWLYEGFVDPGWSNFRRRSQGRRGNLSSAIGRKNPPNHSLNTAL